MDSSTAGEVAVSIIIPTYNRARDLQRALKSVVMQTHHDWEALVIDNNSTDDTDNVVERFGDSRIRIHKIHNQGVVGRSRNLGVALSRGRYAAFLDSDDWWEPEKLECSIAELGRGADLVHHALLVVVRPGQRRFHKRTRTRQLSAPVFHDLIRHGNAIQTSSVVVRRATVLEAGGFSEDATMVGMEDFDLWLRIAKLTNRFALLAAPLGYYWFGGGNLTSPERTLRLLATMESRYGPNLQVGIGDLSSVPYWIHYERGRACFLLGRNRDAKTSLKAIRFQEAPLQIATKSILMRLALMLRGMKKDLP